ncbi:hypothetical protein FGO68_gene3795 [Halteria grandinella]|uniref:Uncharacterized protein n=1 Tax=Halteria grandinella TaxID=5974 RepID=A0A8J8T6C4_HALGN|nr:hypothetical protein FGO68_gene3795 [Halteria grandinella]
MQKSITDLRNVSHGSSTTTTSDLFLDICFKSETTGRTKLVERWKFTFSQHHLAKDSLIYSPMNFQSLMGEYFKKLCIVLRAHLTQIIALPAYVFLRLASLRPPGPSSGNSSKQQQEHQEVLSMAVKGDYKLIFQEHLLKNEFDDQAFVKIQKQAPIKTPMGEISIEVSHLDSLESIMKSLKGQLVRNEQVAAGFVMPSKEDEDEDYLEYRARRQEHPHSFKQTLFKALAPSASNSSLNNLGNLPNQQGKNIFGLQANPKNGQPFDHGRFRAFSDNTQALQATGSGKLSGGIVMKVNILDNGIAHVEEDCTSKFSEGSNIIIQEDYFQPDGTKKLENKIEGSKDGSSAKSIEASSQSNASGAHKQSSQFMSSPQQLAGRKVLNMGIVQTSLEGVLKSKGSYAESPFENSGSSSQRPQRPRVDPFKHFDALPNQQSATRNFRTSFDEAFSGKKSLQTQKSLQSLGQATPFNQVYGGGPTFGYRKASANYPDYSYNQQANVGSAPTGGHLNNMLTDHQIIEEDEHNNDFDLIMVPEKNLSIPQHVVSNGSFDQYVVTNDTRKTVLTSQDLAVRGDSKGMGLLFDFEDDFEQEINNDKIQMDDGGLMLKLEQFQRKLRKRQVAQTSEEKEQIKKNVHQMMLMKSKVVDRYVKNHKLR